MKHLLSLLFVAFLSTQAFAQTTWNADKAHSQVSFGVTHMGISEVEGLFRQFDASITADEADFSDAKYKVTIEVPSIDTGIEMRDNHLKSADFFDAAKYPKMTFVSTSTEKLAEGKYKVTGDLTFHGVTKKVSLDLWYRGTIENPQNGDVISGFQITGNIKRSDFNFGSGFPEGVLSNNVRIKVDAEFKKS